MIVPGDDLDRLMVIMESAFEPEYGEAWTRRQIEDALIGGNCEYYLISDTGEKLREGQPAAGFFLSRLILDECELLLLAVNPELRRVGLGKLLLEELSVRSRTRGARRLFLEMRRGNPAEGLYRRFGFMPIGHRPNYYRTAHGMRIDAITFAMDLK